MCLHKKLLYLTADSGNRMLEIPLPLRIHSPRHALHFNKHQSIGHSLDKSQSQETCYNKRYATRISALCNWQGLARYCLCIKKKHAVRMWSFACSRSQLEQHQQALTCTARVTGYMRFFRKRSHTLWQLRIMCWIQCHIGQACASA